MVPIKLTKQLTQRGNKTSQRALGPRQHELCTYCIDKLFKNVLNSSKSKQSKLYAAKGPTVTKRYIRDNRKSVNQSGDRQIEIAGENR